MKKLRMMLVLISVIGMIFCYTNIAKAADVIDIDEDTYNEIETVNNTTTNTATNTATNNTTTTENNTTTTTSTYTNENTLPQTGVKEDIIVIALVAVCSVSAIYAYTRIKKYSF